MADTTLTTSRPAEAIQASDLPRALRNVSIADAASDAMHLVSLIDAALEKVVVLQVGSGDQRPDAERATALLYVARGLAESLDWKLERLDSQRG